MHRPVGVYDLLFLQEADLASIYVSTANASSPKWISLENISDINDHVQFGELGCGKNSACENTEGSYRCKCKNGFKGDGR